MVEYLSSIDHLIIHQRIEPLEVVTGYETRNKYDVKTKSGQKIYYAIEDSHWCSRNMCARLRPFDMRILDRSKNEVIHLYRPLACDSCCFPCCLQSIIVEAPPGNEVGTVEQNWSLCFPFCPRFSIKNQDGHTVLRIFGPCCTISCCGKNVEFDIMSADGRTKVGLITKQWSGLAREMFTDADFFGISFPEDLDVEMKAVMLGACFLIDMLFYEH